MPNQWEAFLTLQLAICEGWAKLMKDGLAAYQRVLAHQAMLLDQPSCFRARNMIADGADWFDRYGKRQHDVDVERV